MLNDRQLQGSGLEKRRVARWSGRHWDWRTLTGETTYTRFDQLIFTETDKGVRARQPGVVAHKAKISDEARLTDHIRALKERPKNQEEAAARAQAELGFPIRKTGKMWKRAWREGAPHDWRIGGRRRKDTGSA